MRILRIFFKPEGKSWFDHPIPDGMTISQLEGMFRTDGFLINDGGIAPYSAMLFAYTLDFQAAQGNPKVVPIKPLQPWVTPPPPDKPA